MSIEERIRDDPEIKGAVFTEDGYITIIDRDSYILAEKMLERVSEYFILNLEETEE